MDFADLVRTRHSVRHYLPQAVETEKLDRLVEALRLAPSACNAQPWHLVLVEDPDLRLAVAQATSTTMSRINRFAVEAPVLAVLVVEARWTWARIGARLTGRDFPWIDLGIAAAHLCLQAADLGLGTCMLGWFDEQRIRHLLGIPRSRRVGLVVTIGYATDAPVADHRRKPVAEICSRNRYRPTT